jgi:hypothetical protein
MGNNNKKEEREKKLEKGNEPHFLCCWFAFMLFAGLLPVDKEISS